MKLRSLLLLRCAGPVFDIVDAPDLSYFFQNGLTACQNANHFARCSALFAHNGVFEEKFIELFCRVQLPNQRLLKTFLAGFNQEGNNGLRHRVFNLLADYHKVTLHEAWDELNSELFGLGKGSSSLNLVRNEASRRALPWRTTHVLWRCASHILWCTRSSSRTHIRRTLARSTAHVLRSTWSARRSRPRTTNIGIHTWWLTRLPRHSHWWWTTHRSTAHWTSHWRSTHRWCSTKWITSLRPSHANKAALVIS